MTENQEKPSRKVAVLGASGMVGTHLIKQLQQQNGLSIRAVCRSRPQIEIADNLEWHATDLLDLDASIKALHDCQDIFIAAGILGTAPVLARDPITPVLNNLRLTANALEAAWRNGAQRCVWLSSTTGYPAKEEELNETQMFQGEPPDNWYGLGWMTRYMETQCHWYARHVPNPMHIAILRPTMIYGEYDDFNEASAHFLPSLIRRVVHRENPVEIWGTGEQTRDLIHAADVARAACLAINRVKTCSAWNIGAGKSVSVNTCLQQIMDIERVQDLEIAHRHDRPQTISKRCFSTAKAEIDLGFRPEISLEEGLRRTISWYKETIDE